MKSKERIYLVDDDELILGMLSRLLAREGYEVRTEDGGVDILQEIAAWRPAVVLLDINLPGQSGMEILQELKHNYSDMEVIMLTADDSAETAVKAMKMGARDYLTKPFNMEEVKIVIANAIEHIKINKELEYLRKVNATRFEDEFLGASEARITLQEKVAKIAAARVSSVLITGESGVGKELIARNFHRMVHGTATGSSIPFVAVNCSALPDTLLESELFGHEKGAFTDARKSKKGLFEMATGGTLLLDELGDMKLSLQSKLLRALEERVIRRIGGQEEIPVDVTVIATTNRDLADAVEKGEFRGDLFYRLNAFAVEVPSLRERKEDIMFLAKNFLASFSQEYNKTIEGFAEEAEKMMLSYTWPGNVRELKNVVRSIVVLQNTKLVMPEHLPAEIGRRVLTIKGAKKEGYVLPETGISLDDLEKDLIMQAMEMSDHNKTKAAKLLQIGYDSLRYQLKKFGIE